MFASILAVGNELRLAGRSAQDAFQNEGVVNLIRAVIKNDANEAKHLVGSGVNPNAIGKDGATPLIWVMAKGNLVAMKLLLDLGANPNQYIVDGVGPPVWLASGGGKRDALQLLLEYKGDSNLPYGNKSPLMMAVSGSHLDCAELLLEYGADINYYNGPLSALSVAMLHVQFGDALWVLNHRFTHDMSKARRMLTVANPRPGQEELKIKALEIVDQLMIMEQKKSQ